MEPAVGAQPTALIGGARPARRWAGTAPLSAAGSAAHGARRPRGGPGCYRPGLPRPRQRGAAPPAPRPVPPRPMGGAGGGPAAAVGQRRARCAPRPPGTAARARLRLLPRPLALGGPADAISSAPPRRRGCISADVRPTCGSARPGPPHPL